MNLNAALEIVISLVAIFWLVSQLCSYVPESVNSLLLETRAKALERFICEMVLGDGAVAAPQFGKAKGPTEDPLGLLAHALIKSLRKPSVRAKGPGSPPSYIPANTFAQVLMDRLAGLATAAGVGFRLSDTLLAALTAANSPLDPDAKLALSKARDTAAGATGLLGAGAQVLETLNNSTVDQARARLAAWQSQLKDSGSDREISEEANARGLAATDTQDLKTARDTLARLVDEAEKILAGLMAEDPGMASKPLHQTLTTEALWMRAAQQAAVGMAHGGGLVDALRAIVDHGPIPPALREALRPVVANANQDLDAIRKGIETWYDSVMERASGWFKRFTTVWLGVLGFMVGAAFNINPVSITSDLAADPALRRAGATFGEEIVKHGGDTSTGQQFLFTAASERLCWEQRIGLLDETLPKTYGLSASNVSNVACLQPANTGLASLVSEMLPQLVRSGHFVGLIPTVDRLDADRTWSAEALDGFIAKLCVAALSTEAVSSSNQELARKMLADAQGELVPSASSSHDDKKDRACPELRKDFGYDAKGEPKLHKDVVEKFWTNQRVVWDQQLGLELVRARGQDPQRDKAWPASLRNAFRAAKVKAEATTVAARSFFSQIPSLGRQPRLAVPEFWAWLLPASMVSIIGWLILAVMVSFGAPFWFDLLSKLVNRRTTGPRPETDG